MESTHYGVTLGHLDSSKLQLLLDEASASWPFLGVQICPGCIYIYPLVICYIAIENGHL